MRTLLAGVLGLVLLGAASQPATTQGAKHYKSIGEIVKEIPAEHVPSFPDPQWDEKKRAASAWASKTLVGAKVTFAGTLAGSSSSRTDPKTGIRTTTVMFDNYHKIAEYYYRVTATTTNEVDGEKFARTTTATPLVITGTIYQASVGFSPSKPPRPTVILYIKDPTFTAPPKR